MNNNLSRSRYQRVENRRLSHVPHLSRILAGLTTATLLSWTAPALSRTSEAPTLAQASTTEEPLNVELSCVPQGEKILCEAVDEAAMAELQSNLESTTPITATLTSSLASDTHHVSLSSALLVIAIMIGALWGARKLARNQQESEDDEADDLQRQIALLERIWDKSSSA